MLFFYIRHGDPIYDPDSLTEQGRRQAEALAPRLAKFGLDKLFCSTSNRAMQTAAPTERLLGKKATPLEWCREGHAYRDLSVVTETGRRWLFQEKAWRTLLASPKVQALGEAWVDHPAFADMNVKEGMARIARESDAFFASLGYVRDPEKNIYHITSPSDERVALFAHQGFGLAFLSHVLGVPFPLFSTHFDMGHSAMTVIEFADEGGYAIPCVLSLSNDSHLYKSDLPLKYQNRIFF